MGLGPLHSLDQLVDDVARGRHVGVAHAEIDDVDALGAQAGLQPVNLFKDIRRQATDTMEIVVHEVGPSRGAQQKN